MKNKLLEELADHLRQRRLSLLQGLADSQQATTAIVAERESEIEENAQKDRIARLTSRLTARDQNMIREINLALERIDDGTYGQCAWCEGDIKPARLRVLPTAILCIDCATAREKRQRSLSRDRDSERLVTSDKEYESDLETGEMQE
jgi:RNA polymerase-binding transcription factor DksA